MNRWVIVQLLSFMSTSHSFFNFNFGIFLPPGHSSASLLHQRQLGGSGVEKVQSPLQTAGGKWDGHALLWRSVHRRIRGAHSAPHRGPRLHRGRNRSAVLWRVLLPRGPRLHELQPQRRHDGLLNRNRHGHGPFQTLLVADMDGHLFQHVFLRVFAASGCVMGIWGISFGFRVGQMFFSLCAFFKKRFLPPPPFGLNVGRSLFYKALRLFGLKFGEWDWVLTATVTFLWICALVVLLLGRGGAGGGVFSRASTACTMSVQGFGFGGLVFLFSVQNSLFFQRHGQPTINRRKNLKSEKILWIFQRQNIVLWRDMLVPVIPKKIATKSYSWPSLAQPIHHALYS